jgi:hypothetical protein
VAFAPNDLCRFGKSAMHPGRLVGKLRGICAIWRLDWKGNVVERGLLKGLRVTALTVREPEIDQFRAGGPSTLPSNRGKSTVLYGQLIDAELIMQRNVSRRRCGLGRFEVNDPDAAVGLPLDPIGTAREVDPIAAEIDLA